MLKYNFLYIFLFILNFIYPDDFILLSMVSVAVILGHDFPVYIKFDFRYYFYKQLFYEISIPYYILGIKDTKNGAGGSFQAMVNMGFGWRFEFWKENEKK